MLSRINLTVLLIFLVIGFAFEKTNAFVPTISTTTTAASKVQQIPNSKEQQHSFRRSVIASSSSSTTRLFGSTRQNRRDIFQWAKKAVVATTVSTIGLFRSSASSVLAAETVDTIAPTILLDPNVVAEPTGRVVEFTVNNLKGEPGTTGTIKLQLEPSWSPKGVQRFEELTNIGFWKDVRFFRVIPGFIVQFGINGDPGIQSKWRGASIGDDPVRVSNTRGTVVFATAGPNSRTTQLFINTRAQGNAFLDKQGFSPIGKVIEGMEYVDQMYDGYGEGAPAGKGPNQARIQLQGNAYLKESYPKLSYVESVQ